MSRIMTRQEGEGPECLLESHIIAAMYMSLYYTFNAAREMACAIYTIHGEDLVCMAAWWS